jgi:putative ABC transport system permease protein
LRQLTATHKEDSRYKRPLSGGRPQRLTEDLLSDPALAVSDSDAVLFLIFEAIALLLASVGLYAVVSHSVSQRTQEFGMRMAMGATTRDILKLVVQQGLFALAVGLTIGLAASLAINRVLQSQLIHVSPSDPLALTVTSAVLVVSATLGRRAMSVDPPSP